MQKYPGLDHRAIIFGFVATGLLLSVSLFLVYASGSDTKESSTESDSVDVYDALNPDMPTSTTTAVPDPKAVAKKYEEDVRLLVTMVTSSERSLEDLFVYVQDQLLSMRVPQSMLDFHLNAVLTVRSLQEEVKKGALVTLDEVVEVMNKLRIAVDPE